VSDIVIVDNAMAYESFRAVAEGNPFNDERVFGAIDIETTVEENPWANRPELVSVAISFDGYRAFVFKHDTWLERSKAAIEKADWVMQNGLFDRLILHLFDIDVRLVHDTMAIQYLLDPDLPKGLEDLSERYLGLPPYKDVDYHNILDEPWDKVAEMNGEDACRTFNLFRPLADLLNKNKKLSRLYQWLLMDAVNTLIHVTENGIPVDEPNLARATEFYEDKLEKLLTVLIDTAPDPLESVYPKGWPKKRKADPSIFNPASSHQVRHILFDIFKLPVLEVTKPKDPDCDTPSTKADVLLMLETFHAEGEQQEWIYNLRQHRQVSKLVNSYLHSWPAQMHEGWMHPRYKPLHVVTGRLSSEKPNVQQVPRSKEFRNIFGGVEGMTWMKADYSQIELRLAALTANEPIMLQAYRDGGDLHRLTASLILGDDSDEARQVGKTLNFGLLYGAGWATLQKVARSDYEVFLDEFDARRYRENFFATYSRLGDWHDDMRYLISSTGMSTSRLGRVRWLPNAKIPWEVEDMRGKKNQAIREGINMPIQSLASDMLLNSLVQVIPQVEPLGAKVIAEVHDEIDLLVPDENVDKVARIVKDTMEDLTWLKRFGVTLDVPIVADIEVGTHWGTLGDWNV
jgi:DNA polymerase-1